MVTLTLGSPSPPKRQIIELAYGEIGSAGYEFARTAEEISDGLLKLNALMREWPFSTLGQLTAWATLTSYQASPTNGLIWRA
jgi:hypothetical protein